MRFISVILLLFSVSAAWTQNDTVFRHIKTIKGDIIDFTVDNLDNIYILTSSDQLKKINVSGDSVAVYNNITKFGKVSHIDVSNPMRVLLYYKDFATIVVLDRFLNARNTIELRKHGILQANAVGLSYDNSIWVFDEYDHKLKKISEEGNLLFETADFRQLFDQQLNTYSIVDKDGLIYLYDTLQGVMVFDYYGALKNRIPVKNWKNFSVAGKYLFGTMSDTLMRYQPDIFLAETLLLPKEIRDAASFQFTATRAYAMKKDEILIYLIRK